MQQIDMQGGGPELKQRWLALKSTEPGLRARDAAAKLGVSEAELLAARCGEGVRRPDQAIDRATLRQRWQALQDVHDFRDMLIGQGVGRLQAFRLVGEDYAWRVGCGSFRQALEQAAASALPIMIFVGSPGVVQIHTDPVVTLKQVGPWFNVLDPGFNLHLRDDQIAEAWIVRKPTRDGIVTSLVIYDAAGGQIAWMFGERGEGKAERAGWRALAESLPPEGVAVQ